MFKKLKEWLRQPGIIIIKQVAFAVLCVISAVLSINLYTSLASENIEKLFLGMLVGALECVKIYTLARAFGSFKKIEIGNKESWYRKLSAYFNRKNARGFILLAFYFSLSIVSIIGSYGYSLATVNKTEALAAESAITVSSLESDTYDNLIKISNANISLYQASIDKLGSNYPTSTERFSQKIAEETDKIIGYTAKKSEALVKEEAARKASTTVVASTRVNNMFTLLAQNFSWIKPGGLTENEAKFFLLILISILLELGILSTSPKLEDQLKEKKEEPFIDNKGFSFSDTIEKGITNTDVKIVRRPKKAPKPVIVTTRKMKNPKTPKQVPYVVPIEEELEEVIKSPIVMVDPYEHKITEGARQDVLIDKKEVEEKHTIREVKKVEPIKATPLTPENEKHIEEATITYDVAKDIDPVRHVREIPLEPIPVKGRLEQLIKFISALFNNKPNAYLKDKVTAANEAGIALELANSFFHRLEVSGPGGISLLEKREDGHYYPNYTKQYIVDLFQNAVKAKERK